MEGKTKMSENKKIESPLGKDVVKSLSTGDMVLLSGDVYTARDTAHKRMIELLDRGEELPFPLEGAIIYYVGPTPAPPGKVIGAAGPTTSNRMDAYAPRLIEAGLAGMIGKGSRGEEVIDACVKHGCVYFAAIGGAGALMSQSIKSCEVLAWEELGPEAVRLLKVENMPLVVINDPQGRDLYKEGKQKYAVRS